MQYGITSFPAPADDNWINQAMMTSTLNGYNIYQNDVEDLH